MAVLRVLGGGGILENNIVQTGASAGSSIASGVIFTIPALVILGHWTEFEYLWVLAIAGLGGILGVFFSVPLRRALIVDQGLAFPEGKAAAEVLKTGENPAQGVRILAQSALAGGLAKLAAASGLRLFPDTAAGATLGRQIDRLLRHQPVAGAARRRLHRRTQHRHRSCCSAACCRGISRSRSTARSSSTAIPSLAAEIARSSAEDAANAIWATQIRYLGVGAMLVGGVWALISIRKSLLSGIKSGLAAARAGAGVSFCAHRAATCRCRRS